MIVVGAVAGVLLGLLTSRVRRFHVAVQMLVGLVGAAALVSFWYGLDSTTPRPWLAGMMAFTLTAFLGSLVEWRDDSRRRQLAHR